MKITSFSSSLERARNGLLDLEKEISILKTSSALEDPKSWKLMNYMPYSMKTRAHRLESVQHR